MENNSHHPSQSLRWHLVMSCLSDQKSKIQRYSIYDDVNQRKAANSRKYVKSCLAPGFTFSVIEDFFVFTLVYEPNTCKTIDALLTETNHQINCQNWSVSSSTYYGLCLHTLKSASNEVKSFVCSRAKVVLDFIAHHFDRQSCKNINLLLSLCSFSCIENYKLAASIKFYPALDKTLTGVFMVNTI